MGTLTCTERLRFQGVNETFKVFVHQTQISYLLKAAAWFPLGPWRNVWEKNPDGSPDTTGLREDGTQVA